jgi:O-antigen/teichoic acid export membrane protein
MSAGLAQPDLGFEPQLRKVAPNAGRLSASQVVRRLFRMAILLTAARMLTVEDFGAYALLLTILELVSMISGYGYVDFLTREVAIRPGAAWPLGKRVTWIRLGYAAPGVVLATLVLALLGFTSTLILNAALLSLALVPRAAGDSAQGLLKGFGRFAPLLWIEVVQGAFVLGCFLSLSFAGYGLRGLIFAEILGATAGAIVSVGSVIRSLNFAADDSRGFRHLLRTTLVFNLYPLITNIYDRADVVLLSKIAGNVAAGVYSLPYRAFGTLAIIPYSVMGALLPVFSSAQAEDDVKRTCALAMKFLYTAALLVILATLTLAGPAIRFFLGENYAGSIITLKILVWASVPDFLNFALNTLLLAAHKEKAFLVTATVCTVFNITANLLLIPRYSFVAAAAVTVATECLLLVQNLYLVHRFMHRLVLPADGFKITGCFAVALAVFWALQHQIPQVWAGTIATAVFAAFSIKMLADFRGLRGVHA